MKRVLALVLLSVATAADASGPQLNARPGGATVSSLPAGETILANDAIAYRPARLASARPALFILLQGAGHSPADFLEMMESAADRRGVILLMPKSAATTWDMVANAIARRDVWKGPDTARMDATLSDLFARTPVDPSRIALIGFSDGATFALTLGTANPQLFRRIVALSPGFIVLPSDLDGRQRIFLAHGTRDRVLPLGPTENMARELRDAGMVVRLRRFDGGHEIDPAVLDDAVAFAVDGPSR